MRKILLFLLFPVLLNAQVEFLGLVSIQDTVKYDHTEAFALLSELPAGLKHDGSDVIFFPIAKIYTDSSFYLMLIDSIYYAQFDYDKNTDRVMLKQPETWLVEYSLKNKKFKAKKKYVGDVFDIFYPEDLEKKIKDKIKKDKP